MRYIKTNGLPSAATATVKKSLRIALLLPTVELGMYWQPVLSQIAQSHQVILYTGRPWGGFDPQDPDTASIQVVGKTVRVTSATEKTDYSGGYMRLSPIIIVRLLKFKPDTIFASGFSMWTILALIFKPIGRWRVAIAWEGSSPHVDFRHSASRLAIRRAIVRFADTFITNTEGGKSYLIDCLGVAAANIRVRPYLVPDLQRLSARTDGNSTLDLDVRSPVFLYVGRIEERKGIHLLLQACSILQQNGSQFSLLIAGRGPQQAELMAYCRDRDLEDRVMWLGFVDYRQLGMYFERADVFVFPSLEDTWGTVVPEAMAFGKPVLSSKWAGASELITDGIDGWVCDPHSPEEMARLMQRAIDRPELVTQMGQAAKATIAPHNPQAVAEFFVEISRQMLGT